MNLRSLFIAVGLFFVLIIVSFAQEDVEVQGGAEIVSNPFVSAWESFSYPLDLFVQAPNIAGDSINGGTGGVNSNDINGSGGWTSPWILDATSYETELSETQIDTDRILHQDPFVFPGSFSLIIRTPAINGPVRSFPTISQGELWISFVYQDTGPVEDHDSGMFILNAAGTKLFLLGKPRNADVLGISHLPEGVDDQLTQVSYSESHLLMARIVLDDLSGLNDDIYFWVDPDENDRLDTYDAGGEDIADIDSMSAIMLSRRQDTGSGFFDDICISTFSSLAPAGTVRVDLGFDPTSPLRKNTSVVLHDVISIDSYFDSLGGPGYGHNQEQDYFMVVRGYIYYDDQGASRVARGIPVDRMSGLFGFAIAPFNDSFEDSDSTSSGKNALRFHPETGTAKAIALTVPHGNYGQCRLLTSGDGFGNLAMVVKYEDGTTQEAQIQSPDWLDDPVDDGHGGVIPGDIIQINNGMDRLDASAYFEGSNPITATHPELDDASFFVGRVALDKTKTVVGIDLGPSSGSVINVYDMLLDTESDVTPVVDWMMY